MYRTGSTFSTLFWSLVSIVMGWNGNYFSRPTFGCVDIKKESVHLGNQETVMQWNVRDVTAGKLAWDDILKTVPIGHLLGSTLFWEWKKLKGNLPPVWKETLRISLLKHDSLGEKEPQLKKKKKNQFCKAKLFSSSGLPELDFQHCKRYSVTSIKFLRPVFFVKVTMAWKTRE